MNYKIGLVFSVSFIITTMANVRMDDDPEIKPEIDKIKTKLCSNESRPTAEQWTEMDKCSTEQKQHFEKMKEYFKDCIEKCTDVDNLKPNNEFLDVSVCYMCSAAFKECMNEKNQKWKENRGEKNEEFKQSDEFKEKMKQLKDKYKTKLECDKRALGIE